LGEVEPETNNSNVNDSQGSKLWSVHQIILGLFYKCCHLHSDISMKC